MLTIIELTRTVPGTQEELDKWGVVPYPIASLICKALKAKDIVFKECA